MKTSAEVIARLGGAAKLAPEIDEPANTIRQWAARDSIPARCWQSIVNVAHRQGEQGVTLEVLARIAKAKAAA